VSIFEPESLPIVASSDISIIPPVANLSANRSITAAVSRLRLDSKSIVKELDRPATREWQTLAWTYFDAIGEVKFALNLVASVMSRVRLFPAVVVDYADTPVPVDVWIENAHQTSVSMNKLREVGDEAINALNSGAGISQLLKSFSLNIDVGGEMFFIGMNGKYTIVSSEEIKKDRKTNGYILQSTRESGQRGVVINLDPDTYVARIWRPHPRWSREPDSSLLGVLDQCEKMLLIDKALRATARSRMNAGALFIPDGINVPITEHDDDDEDDVENAFIEAWTGPITDESVATSVVPLILRGNAELGDRIKQIDIARVFDPQLVDEAKRSLDRVLAGLDVPKDLVTGLSDVKYSNAVIIDDSLYRAHVEPKALLCVDSLTKIFFQPYLRKAGLPEDLVRRAVLWYDPSSVVTRPDRSTAANEGYDRNIISEKAWRTARGFSEADAPEDQERLRRLAYEKGQLQPATYEALVEHFSPEVFDDIRRSEAQQAGTPEEVTQLLSGQAPAPSPAQAETGPEGDGGEIPQGGTMPPRGES
jgi:hypothetical protein